jgi:hypothetical protein
MAWKEICAISLISIILMLALPNANASSDALSDLNSSISSFDDSRMDTQDLAFYLVTHGFDVTPKDGYVEANLGGKIYKLTPNGKAPGLASIMALIAP